VPSFAAPGGASRRTRDDEIWKTCGDRVLAGTLGVVGCSDDTENGGTGGTGGTGGSGGTGGTGGTPPACSEGPLAETGQTGTGALTCVATIPFGLTVRFNATPVSSLQQGSNDFRLQMEVAIDAETVNDVLVLAPGVVVDVNAVGGRVNPTMGDSDPTPVDVEDEAVPCSLAFEMDTPAAIVTTVSEGSFTLDEGGTLELTLEAITQEVTALGIPVVLTTEGEEPSCEFVDDPPSVQFTLPQ
jgi:hypothetical protein